MYAINANSNDLRGMLMEYKVFLLLRVYPEIALFVIIALGFFLGKLNLWGISLGAPLSVLIISILLGSVGIESIPVIGSLGFIFFVYSIGYQSGPHFFALFNRDSLGYVQIGIIMIASAFLVALGATWIFDFELGYLAGILSGSLTNTPMLAAAQDTVNSGILDTVLGYSSYAVENNIGIAYSVTYVIGMVGVIVLFRFLPSIFRFRIKESADQAMQNETLECDDQNELGLGGKGVPMTRTYRVSNSQSVGHSLMDLLFLQATGAVITQLLRNGQDIQLGPDTVLQENDYALVLGYNEAQIKAGKLLGEEIIDEILQEIPIETRNIILTNRKLKNVTLRDTGVTNAYSCITLKIIRDRVELPLSLDMKLRAGDYMVVSGTKDNLERLAKHIGHLERRMDETDLFAFSFGVIAGLFISYCSINLGNISFSLSAAVGLLISGLCIGWARTRHPVFGQVPGGARFLLRELGLLFFLTNVGLNAGPVFFKVIQSDGLFIILAGIVTAIVPVFVGILYGKYILKMNPAILIGAVAGGMTNPSAFKETLKHAGNNVPALGYSHVYAFSIVVLTLLGQIIMYMMS